MAKRPAASGIVEAPPLAQLTPAALIIEPAVIGDRAGGTWQRVAHVPGKFRGQINVAALSNSAGKRFEAQAARVLGSTLRGFNFLVREAGRIAE